MASLESAGAMKFKQLHESGAKREGKDYACKTETQQCVLQAQYRAYKKCKLLFKNLRCFTCQITDIANAAA